MSVGPGNEFTQTSPVPAQVNDFHRFDDSDTSQESHHHTLGLLPNQAAAGNHTHNRTRFVSPEFSDPVVFSGDLDITGPDSGLKIDTPSGRATLLPASLLGAPLPQGTDFEIICGGFNGGGLNFKVSNSEVGDTLAIDIDSNGRVLIPKGVDLTGSVIGIPVLRITKPTSGFAENLLSILSEIGASFVNVSKDGVSQFKDVRQGPVAATAKQLPVGILSHVVKSTNTTFSTAAETAIVTTASLATVSGRSYKITGHVRSWTNTAGAAVSSFRAKVAGVQVQECNRGVTVANTGENGVSFSAIYTAPSTLSRVFSFAVQQVTGAGSSEINAAATFPSTITVEDLGVIGGTPF